jgi:hypothetical protein
LLGEFISWFFYCPQPRLYSHEFVPSSLDLSELFRLLYLLLSVFHYLLRKIHVLIEIRQSVVVILIWILFVFFVFFFFFFFSFVYFVCIVPSIEIPDDYGSVQPSKRNHIVRSETNSSHVRTVTVESLMDLLGDICRVFEQSNALIVVSNG